MPKLSKMNRNQSNTKKKIFMFLARVCDIIAVPGNPPENIRDLEEVLSVMNGGEIQISSFVEVQR